MSNQSLKDWRERMAYEAIKEPRKAKYRDRLDAMMVIATILSSIATTAAVVVGVYQYGVARDQLVAADRNRSIQMMTEHARTVCRMVEQLKVVQDIVNRPSRPTIGSIDRGMEREFAREILDDLMKADIENRVFYDLEKVEKISIPTIFRDEYAKAYADLRSAAQTTRLWIAERDEAGLRALDEEGFEAMNPRIIFVKAGDTYKLSLSECLASSLSLMAYSSLGLTVPVLER